MTKGRASLSDVYASRGSVSAGLWIALVLVGSIGATSMLFIPVRAARPVVGVITGFKILDAKRTSDLVRINVAGAEYYLPFDDWRTCRIGQSIHLEAVDSRLGERLRVRPAAPHCFDPKAR